MERVLALTGATGRKSGGAFFRLLAANREALADSFSQPYRVLVRPSSDTKKLLALLPDTDVRRGDLGDEAFLRDALRGVDTLVHIAGIRLSLPIVRAAAECGVRRLILVHTTGIYSKYKKAGETYRQIDAEVYAICRQFSVILTILRPTMIYGRTCDNNVSHFIRMVDKFPLMPVVNGARYELQPVYCEDLAAAYFSVLTHEEATAGKDYDLSGGAPILLRDMLKEIGAQLGKKRVRFLSVPYALAYAGALALYALSLGRKDLREKVQRLCEPRAYSHEAATRDFGYAPVEFAEGVKAEIREYLAEKNKGAERT